MNAVEPNPFAAPSTPNSLPEQQFQVRSTALFSADCATIRCTRTGRMWSIRRFGWPRRFVAGTGFAVACVAALAAFGITAIPFILIMTVLVPMLLPRPQPIGIVSDGHVIARLDAVRGRMQQRWRVQDGSGAVVAHCRPSWFSRFDWIVLDSHGRVIARLAKRFLSRRIDMLIDGEVCGAIFKTYRPLSVTEDLDVRWQSAAIAPDTPLVLALLAIARVTR